MTLKWEDIVIAALILVMVYLFRKVIEKLIFGIIRRFTGKMSKEHFEASVKGFEKPTAALIGFIGLYIAFQYLSVHYPILRVYTGDTPERLMKAITVICIAMGFYNLGDLYGSMLIKLDDKLNLNTSVLFKEMISKVTRALIVILAVGMAASEFFDVNGFIAGLGIAGLAVAMAAQDTLGNMIAGAAIVVDRPYDLGDWILCEGIEGEVEELTFRSTRIRTVTQEIVYIPNSNMSKNPITNFTRRGFRRVDIQTVLEFSTELEQIEALQQQMET
jgi:MscS family membrane protein